MIEDNLGTAIIRNEGSINYLLWVTTSAHLKIKAGLDMFINYSKAFF
jgi:hypothetical protein